MDSHVMYAPNDFDLNQFLGLVQNNQYAKLIIRITESQDPTQILQNCKNKYPPSKKKKCV